MLLMLMEVLPVFMSVAVFGPPAWPTLTLPQLRDVGEAVAVPALETPEPESATESVPEPSFADHVAARAPVAAGLKKIFTVQLAEAARLEPQVAEETAKSAPLAPEIPAPLSETEADVPLVTVMVCEALAPPTLTLPNDKPVGDAVTDELTPRPERGTSCGLLPASSVKSSAAVRVPEVVGLKRTVTVQLAEGARVEPHVC